MFDLLETLGVLGLLASYPDLPAGLVFAVVIATPFKWLALLGVSALIVGGEIAWWRKRHRR
jgi:hypothetical protein